MAQEAGLRDKQKGGLRGAHHETLEKVESRERVEVGTTEGVSDERTQPWGWGCGRWHRRAGHRDRQGVRPVRTCLSKCHHR